MPMFVVSVGALLLAVLIAGGRIERAIGRLTAALRPAHPDVASDRGPAATPAPAPVRRRTAVSRDLAEPVDAAVERAYLDYDVYRVAGWLPGEHDYRAGGGR